jgi:hypothetical protein
MEGRSEHVRCGRCCEFDCIGVVHMAQKSLGAWLVWLKITGANADGARQLQIGGFWTARIAQFPRQWSSYDEHARHRKLLFPHRSDRTVGILFPIISASAAVACHGRAVHCVAHDIYHFFLQSSAVWPAPVPTLPVVRDVLVCSYDFGRRSALLDCCASTPRICFIGCRTAPHVLFRGGGLSRIRARF